MTCINLYVGIVECTLREVAGIQNAHHAIWQESVKNPALVHIAIAMTMTMMTMIIALARAVVVVPLTLLAVDFLAAAGALVIGKCFS